MAYAPQEEKQQYDNYNNNQFGGYQQEDNQFGQPQQQQQQEQQQQQGFNCSLCHKAFTKDGNNEIKYKAIGDKLLHFECFRCSNCNNMIQGKFNTKEDGTYVCVNCIAQQYGQDTHIVPLDKNNPNYCTACDKQLTQNWVVGRKGDKYHNYCFKCMQCGTPLAKEPEGYCEGDDGRNYCKPCRTKQMQ